MTLAAARSPSWDWMQETFSDSGLLRDTWFGGLPVLCRRTINRLFLVSPIPERASVAPGLFTFAAHLVIPVPKRAVGFSPPSPDVQLEMCRQAVPVRAADELK